MNDGIEKPPTEGEYQRHGADTPGGSLLERECHLRPLSEIGVNVDLVVVGRTATRCRREIIDKIPRMQQNPRQI